jgi:hypothetical protein
MIINPFRIISLAINSGGVYPARIPLFILYVLKANVSFLLSLVERLFFRRRISAQKIQSPVIILGHYRSGTTLLHKLLLTDKKFGYITYVNVVFPFCSILSSKASEYLSRFIKRLNIRNWAFNNTAFIPEDPTEEDLMMISAGMKPSLAWGFLFPLNAVKLMTASILFRDRKYRKEWQAAYHDTLKKISYKSRGKRLLLKNPPNTGRIGALVELFPDSKFIFICRNPYHVFLSTKNLWQNSVSHVTLQKIPAETRDEIILNVYLTLMNRYEQEKHLIPRGNLVEIRYEDLLKAPFTCIETLYHDLGLEGFESLRTDYTNAVSREQGYPVNHYPMAKETVAMVDHHLGFYIKKWNYGVPDNVTP